MEILEYDHVDPLGVLNLNLASLGYALTPERVQLIRQLDLRPMPFFGVYAVEEGFVAGQVAVYRLPVVTSDGPEEVGGVCAVCTHPAFSRRGVATRLMDEAHERMRQAGLRFAMMGTARHRAAYAFYHLQGYEDIFTARSVFVCRADVQQKGQLRAERAGLERLALTDEIFCRSAAGYLGFARRHQAFIPMLVTTCDLAAEEVWLLWSGTESAGYALAGISEGVLHVHNLLLLPGVDAANALAALAGEPAIRYLRVRIDHPDVAASLKRAGYPQDHPDWAVVMVKPLSPDVSANDARRLMGIGTPRFLVSFIDVT